MRKDALVRGLSEIFPYTFREKIAREKNDAPLEARRALRYEAIADKYHVALLGCFTEDDSILLDEAFCNRVRHATSFFIYQECLRLQQDIYVALGHALSCQKTCPARVEEHMQSVHLHEQIMRDVRCVYERIMNEIEDYLAEEVVSLPQTPVFQDVTVEPIAFPAPFVWTNVEYVI